MSTPQLVRWERIMESSFRVDVLKVAWSAEEDVVRGKVIAKSVRV